MIAVIFPPTVSLLAAAVTWFLVLPKWTGAALVLCLVSCALFATLGVIERETLLWRIVAFVIYVLYWAALLMIPVALAFRIGSLVFAIVRRS